MNIQNLVGLTTQNKASDFLAKSVPSDPQIGLTQDLTETAAKAALKDGETTETTETTDSTATLVDTVAADANDRGQEFNTFLTLLTAQIRNQDPLAPLDSTQFVEQLATFTNLELQANGNASLERIENMLAQDQLRQSQLESSDDA